MSNLRNLLILSIMVLLSSSIFLVTYSVNAAPRSVGFKKSCPAKRGTIKRMRGGWTFNLKHGDVGGCPTDNRARHGAPYWERAELRSSYMRKNRTYEFSFDVKFDPTKRSSRLTSFFQIHSYAPGCARCVQMLSMRANGSSIAAHLQNNKGLHVRHNLGISRASLANNWRTFKIRVGTSAGYNRISIWVDGRKVLSERSVYLDPKGKPYLKVGLYRPGSKGGLPSDSVSIRRVKSETVK